MARFSPIRVNYVAFYFKDWIVATSIMSTIERGIYSSLVFHIYETGGRLENKTALLASISGLSELEFSTYWERLKHKFVQIGNYLSHKRCMIELRKTYQLTQNQRKAGLASAKKRKEAAIIPYMEEQRRCNGVSTALQPLNETNTKQNNNKTKTKNNNPVFEKVLDTIQVKDKDLNSSLVKNKFSEGDKLLLYQAISMFFDVRTQSQKTFIDNICKWAVNHPQGGKEFNRRLIDIADEAKKNAKTNRWGYFLGGLRRQLGYVPPSKQN